MGRRHYYGHFFCPEGEVGDVVVNLRKHQVSSRVLVEVIREGFQEGLIYPKRIFVFQKKVKSENSTEHFRGSVHPQQ